MPRRLVGNRKQIMFAGALLLAVIITAAVMLNGGRGQAGKGRQTGDDMKPVVNVQTVVRKDMVRRISLTGQTVPEAQVDMAAKYTGRITAVNVKLGDQVTAGQVLLVQDTGDVELSIAQNDAARRQAEADVSETQASFAANYDKAQADYQRCLTNYERYKSLYAVGAISRESLDSTEQQMINAKSVLAALANQTMAGTVPAAIEGKRAALAKAERSIDALNKQREDMILFAPRSGVIGYRQAEVGALVQAGQKLLSIVDNSSIYVDCQVPEQDAAVMTTGMAATVQIESLGKSYPGMIIYISPANDAKTQSFTARIALDQPDEMLKSGMFARTQLAMVARPQTLSVRKEAVQEKNGKAFVYVIDADGVAREQTVEVGLRTDREVEILTGLNEGDQVAVSNISRIKTGVAVAVKPAGTEAGGDGQ